jgi:hypothetical protein
MTIRNWATTTKLYELMSRPWREVEISDDRIARQVTIIPAQ